MIISTCLDRDGCPCCGSSLWCCSCCCWSLLCAIICCGRNNTFRGATGRQFLTPRTPWTQLSGRAWRSLLRTPDNQGSSVRTISHVNTPRKKSRGCPQQPREWTIPAINTRAKLQYKRRSPSTVSSANRAFFDPVERTTAQRRHSPATTASPRAVALVVTVTVSAGIIQTCDDDHVLPSEIPC